MNGRVIARCERLHPLVVVGEDGSPVAVTPRQVPEGWIGARCARCKRDYTVRADKAEIAVHRREYLAPAIHVQSRDGLVSADEALVAAITAEWSVPIGIPDGDEDARDDEGTDTR